MKVTLSKDKIPDRYHICSECSSRLDFHVRETQEIWSNGEFHGNELKCPVCDNISYDSEWIILPNIYSMRSDLESVERRLEILQTNFSWRNMSHSDKVDRLEDTVYRLKSRLDSLLYGVLGIVLVIFVSFIIALLRQV